MSTNSDVSSEEGAALPSGCAADVRPIPGFPGYAITEEGVVWSRRRGIRWRALRGHRDVYGYQVVGLSENGQTRYLKVHRLVLMAFVGPPGPGQMACHDDGNRSNNRLSNLRWGTAQDNSDDMLRHGTRVFGERNSEAKLTSLRVQEIREAYATGTRSIRHLARTFAISPSQVARIVQGLGWRETGGPVEGRSSGYRRGEDHKSSKLTADQVREIRQLYAGGLSQEKIARQFGVWQSTIGRIVQRRCWTHVA